MVDEAGYLQGDVDGLAEKLGVPQATVERVLKSAARRASRPASARARSPSAWRCN